MRPVPDPDRLKSIAATLLTGAQRGIAPEEARSLFRELCAEYSMPGITRSCHQVWFRARLCEHRDGFSNVKQMIYPESGSLSYGRASMPGAKILYAGWNPRLALEEISAKTGQFVQTIALRVRAPLDFPCAIVGEHQSIFNSGVSIIGSQKLEAGFQAEYTAENPLTYPQVFVDSVLAEIFRSPSKDPATYVASAAIADQVLSHRQGLMYPSVRTMHAVNLAVRAEDFDETFEVLYSSVSRVNAYHGYGLYDLEPIRQTCAIDQSGEFDWRSNRQFSGSVGTRNGLVVSPDFIGWRKR